MKKIAKYASSFIALVCAVVIISQMFAIGFSANEVTDVETLTSSSQNEDSSKSDLNVEVSSSSINSFSEDTSQTSNSITPESPVTVVGEDTTSEVEKFFPENPVDDVDPFEGEDLLSPEINEKARFIGERYYTYQSNLSADRYLNITLSDGKLIADGKMSQTNTDINYPYTGCSLILYNLDTGERLIRSGTSFQFSEYTVDVSDYPDGSYRFSMCGGMAGSYYTSGTDVFFYIENGEPYFLETINDIYAQEVYKSLDSTPNLNGFEFQVETWKATEQETLDEMQATALEVTEGLTSDYEKLRAINHWVATNIKYENGPYQSDAIYGFKNRVAACGGYTRIMIILLGYVGIRAEGVSNLPNGGGLHAYNAVYIDGQWSFVDATWNVYDFERYFMMTPRQVASLGRPIGVYNNPGMIAYEVSVSAGENGSISPSGGVAQYGGWQILDFTAQPNEGYILEGWYENGEKICTTEQFIFCVDSKERNITAKFVRIDEGTTSSTVTNPNEQGVILVSVMDESQKPVAGIEFALIDNLGNIKNGISDGTGYLRFPIERGKTYSLEKVSDSNGYTGTFKQEGITFENNGKIFSYTALANIQTENTENQEVPAVGGSGSPQTGDNDNIVRFSIIFASAFVALFAIVSYQFYIKKKS